MERHEPTTAHGEEPSDTQDTQRTLWAFLEIADELAPALDRSVERHGLIHVDVLILSRLRDELAGEVRAQRLASAVGTNASRLSRRIDHLEQLGAVKRRPCVEDGRSVFICITDSGSQLLRDALPELSGVLGEFLGRQPSPTYSQHVIESLASFLQSRPGDSRHSGAPDSPTTP